MRLSLNAVFSIALATAWLTRGAPVASSLARATPERDRLDESNARAAYDAPNTNDRVFEMQDDQVHLLQERTATELNLLGKLGDTLTLPSDSPASASLARPSLEVPISESDEALTRLRLGIDDAAAPRPSLQDQQGRLISSEKGLPGTQTAPQQLVEHARWRLHLLQSTSNSNLFGITSPIAALGTEHAAISSSKDQAVTRSLKRPLAVVDTSTHSTRETHVADTLSALPSHAPPGHRIPGIRGKVTLNAAGRPNFPTAADVKAAIDQLAGMHSEHAHRLRKTLLAANPGYPVRSDKATLDAELFIISELEKPEVQAADQAQRKANGRRMVYPRSHARNAITNPGFEKAPWRSAKSNIASRDLEDRRRGQANGQQ